MANVLFAWELGGGLGHLTRMAPLARQLRQRGHRVHVAAQDVTRVPQVLGDIPVLPSPFVRPAGQRVQQMHTMADILHNAGAVRREALAAILRAWCGLFDLVRPDLLIADYAPFALAAARGRTMRTAILANGFDCPPDTGPLVPFRKPKPADTDAVLERETSVLTALNEAIGAMGGRPLDYLARLFHDTDAVAFGTFPELDAYPQRQGAEYWGVWSAAATVGQSPTWPEGNEPRAFGYLKGFDHLDPLLARLAQAPVRTVAFVSGADADRCRRRAGRRLRLVFDPLDTAAATISCDMAITHAGINTLSALLLAGRPVLCLPLQYEQYLLGRKVEALGAGLCADVHQRQAMLRTFDRFITEQASLAAGARRFAEGYAGFDPTEQVSLLTDRLASLLP
jgi:hypothetical protein